MRKAFQHSKDRSRLETLTKQAWGAPPLVQVGATGPRQPSLPGVPWPWPCNTGMKNLRVSLWSVTKAQIKKMVLSLMHCTGRTGSWYICLYHEPSLLDVTGSLRISKGLVKEWLKLHLGTFCWSCLRHYELYKLHMQHTCKDIITVGIFPWSVLIFSNKICSRGIFSCSGSDQLFFLARSVWVLLVFVSSPPPSKGWKSMRIKVNSF